ncbi:MAG: TrmH family RNA methyltransferase [Bacteroidetes bacterium]|nr:TrmH family RNA methyltransferase [Bacteroidota bacterium]
MANSSVDLFNELGTSRFLEGVYPPIIIADNLRTPENMGLVLRLAGNIGSPLTLFLSSELQDFRKSKIKKTSSGASEIVVWKTIKPEELAKYLPSDYEIVALETSKDAKNIFTFKFPQKTAIVVGNEVRGISKEIIDQANYSIYIPIPGSISSLNVTHALSVAIFLWMKQFSM